MGEVDERVRALRQKAVDALAKFGTPTEAAKALGIPRQTLISRVDSANRDGLKAESTAVIEYPVFPKTTLSAREIIEREKKSFALQKEHHDAQQWFTIKINDDRPIGVAFVGDTHIDSPKRDIVTLDRDFEIIANTDGMYGLNGGDLQDNWVGRLARLYAETAMSRTETGALIKYYLGQCGVKWLAVLLGNHDLWSDGAQAMIQSMCATDVPVLEWEAKFQLQFPNKRVCRIWARHDFAGHSMWSDNHALQRAQKMEEDAHIYSGNHRHVWQITNGENVRNGQCYWLVRSAGYKTTDQYAKVKGFPAKQAAATVTAIIDPRQPEGSPEFVTCFASVPMAATVLKILRSK